MTRPTRVVDTMLAQLNPVPAADLVRLDERAQDDLARILVCSDEAVTTASERVGGVPVPTRRLVLSAAGALAAGVVAVGAVPFPDRHGNAAHAATPKPLDYQQPHASMNPSTLLTGIAARTATLPDTAGSGRYAHVQTRSWDLFTRIGGKQVTSTVVPLHRDQWVADDGSGRSVVTATLPGGRYDRTDHRAVAGELGLFWPLRSLSDNDATLARQLQAAHPIANGPAERFIAIQDAYLQMPLSPRVRAATLRYLAATPGLTVAGNVTDRSGRRGTGFSVDSAYSGLPTRYTLIIDPHDGQLLDSEEMLTTSAGKLNVPVPSVIGYTVFLASQYTDTTK